MGVPCAAIGTTGGERLVIHVNGREAVNLPLSECKAAWKDAIPCLIG
jgi:phosphoribosylformylglycinamidine synthase